VNVKIQIVNSFHALSLFFGSQAFKTRLMTWPRCKNLRISGKKEICGRSGKVIYGSAAPFSGYSAAWSCFCVLISC